MNRVSEFNWSSPWSFLVNTVLKESTRSLRVGTADRNGCPGCVHWRILRNPRSLHGVRWSSGVYSRTPGTLDALRKTVKKSFRLLHWNQVNVSVVFYSNSQCRSMQRKTCWQLTECQRLQWRDSCVNSPTSTVASSQLQPSDLSRLKLISSRHDN